MRITRRGERYQPSNPIYFAFICQENQNETHAQIYVAGQLAQ